MASSPAIFVGVDLSGGRNPFTYAAFDSDCRLSALAGGELEDVLAFLGGTEVVRVAVNAPPRPNRGLVRKTMEQGNPNPGHLRGTDLRLAEYELRQRGLAVSPTPSRPETCAAWMQAGFEFYRRLTGMGFEPHPAGDAPRQWLETHPHAAFAVLLEQLPLPKPTLEGRLQRQLVLFEHGAGIRDAMDFFEEITRHKLLRGALPLESIYAAEELDALAAAFTAWQAFDALEETILVGDRDEGQISLPSTELKDQYL